MARYEITAPDGSRYEVTAPDGADEKAVMAYAQSQWKPEKKSPEYDNSIGRQIGLTARAGIKGLVGIPAMVGDAMGLKTSQTVDSLLGKFLPEPANQYERIAGDVAGAMAGGAGFAKAAGQFAPELGRNIGTQIMASGAGAGAAGTTREEGGSPGQQMIAGLAGGLAVPAAYVGAAEASRAAGRLAQGAARPFTQSGRTQIVSDTMRRNATNPDAAAANMANAEMVPGAIPTSAQAGADIGLFGLERALRTQRPAEFASRALEQNAARTARLAQVAKTPEQVQIAKASRDAWATAKLDEVFSQSKVAETAPAVKLGNAMLEAGAKYRGKLGSELRRFVDDIAEIQDPQVLYNGPRKAISDAISGKMSNDSPLAAFSKRELIGLQKELDSVIERAAPGYRNYLTTYKGLSRPIDRLETLQELQRTTRNAIGDVTGQDVISPAKFSTRSREVLRDLSPAQRQAVESINDDLQRSAQSFSAIKAPGSDTAQNLAAQSILRQTLGNRAPENPVMQATLNRALGFAYRPMESRIQDELLQAMLDPETAQAMLMMQGSRSTAPTIQEIISRLGAVPSQGLFGAAYGQGPR